MPTWKNFPWVSLTLLLFADYTLGWWLSAFREPWYIVVVVAGGILLLNTSLYLPGSKSRNNYMRLVKSDTRASSAAVAIAFLLVVIITWLHAFIHALLVIAASSILCTLDARKFGLSEAQTFGLLSVVSLGGLGLGGMTQQLYLQILSYR